MKHKPKQPSPAYFKFRIMKLKELKDDPDKNKKIKGLWDTVDPKLKNKL